jgi:hypothetical protein
MKPIELEKNLNWIVNKGNNRVLARRATYDPAYQYYLNMPGSYEIYLEDSGIKVSNIIKYKIDKITPNIGSPEQRLPEFYRYNLTVNDQQCVTRTTLGEKDDRGLQWVIIKDGRIMLERVADKEINYCNMLRIAGPFKIYLKQGIKGDYYKVSEAVISNADAVRRAIAEPAN